MPSKAEQLFASKAPWIMELLMRDFAVSLDDSAAVLGNLGHECAGFTLMQEQKPTVKGSRGGYGWAQWTGPRRVAFEAYCARNHLDPASDRANYGWLFVELLTSEKRAIPAVRNAKGLAAKVKAFEQNFERAGVKYYPSRNQWAERAKEAYLNAWNMPGEIELPAWALPAAARPASETPPRDAAPPPVPAPVEPSSTPPATLPEPDRMPEPPAVPPAPAGKGGVIAAILLLVGAGAAYVANLPCDWFGVFCS